MSENIEVTVAGFGGSQTVQVPRGATIEVAANGVDNLSPDAVIRFKGQRVAPTGRDSIVLEDGDRLSATPPEAKQG